MKNIRKNIPIESLVVPGLDPWRPGGAALARHGGHGSHAAAADAGAYRGYHGETYGKS